jgi:hypothetical protein
MAAIDAAISAIDRNRTNVSSREGMKPPSGPKSSGLRIDGIDHEGMTPDQTRGLDTTRQGVLDEAGTDPTSSPRSVRR